ncbi:MAG TPA: bacteriohemerythrin [Rhodospirillales bacterium]|nr:bacteriohemerythrin [Rhodospirillales bacterium]
MNMKIHSPLSRRLIIYIVLCSSVITLFLTAIQLYRDYQADVQAIDASFEQIRKVHLKTIAMTAWASDKEKLQALLDGISNLQDIEFVSVDSGEDVISIGRITSDNIISWSSALTYPYRGRLLEIGVLKVVANLDAVYSRIINRAVVILISNAIKTILVAGFMLLIFHLIVTRHLMHIADFVSNISLGQSFEPLKLNRRSADGRKEDELEKVVNSINDAATRVIRYFSRAQKAEKAQRQSEESLRTTLNSIGDAVIATDISGNIILMNPIAEALTGYKLEEAVGEHLDQIFHIVNAKTRKPAFSPVDTVLAKGKIVGLANHTTLIAKDGAEYQIADSASPIRDNANNITGVVLVFRDVTEDYAIREDLHNALVDAERANEAKSEFLASMSHELRTPMNAVLGYAQMLQLDPKNPLSSAQNMHVENILLGGSHLLELINEVLDLARIEADHVSLSLEKVNANKVAADCVDLSTPLGKQRGIKIIDQFSSGPLAHLRTDRIRLIQVLINLLSNAVKFNKDGGTVTVDGRKTGDGFLRISVTDTGIGIAKEDFVGVFQMFHRLGADPMIAREGTGIGLTVTKLLVERMAGRVGFESEEGVGSTFWIELPLNSNKKVLIWADNVCVGVDAMDKDHQAIFRLLNKLTYRTNGDAGLDEAVEELMDYTHYHFRREEAIMGVCNYPNLKKHCGLHRKFIVKVNDLSEKWRKDRDPKRLHNLRKFLRDWWIDHIVNVDAETSQYAKGKEQDIRLILESLR